MFRLLKPQDRHTKCNRCNYFGCTAGDNGRGQVWHWVWVFQFYKRKARRYTPLALYRRFVSWLTRLDYSKISDVDVDGIDTRDYPDFCDAFIASATYKGRPMSDAELDRLNSDSDFVYEAVQAHLY